MPPAGPEAATPRASRVAYSSPSTPWNHGSRSPTSTVSLTAAAIVAATRRWLTGAAADGSASRSRSDATACCVLARPCSRRDRGSEMSRFQQLDPVVVAQRLNAQVGGAGEVADGEGAQGAGHLASVGPPLGGESRRRLAVDSPARASSRVDFSGRNEPAAEILRRTQP